MDFFNIARAAEQAVYEIAAWLYFYPATLLKVLFRPVKMMEYAGRESDVPQETAFSGAMRPALLLLISIVIGASVVPLRFYEEGRMPQVLRDSWLYLVMFRFIIFAFFPIVGAIICDRFTEGEVTRQSLKKPFNQQAYIYAPFALIVSPALVLLQRDNAEMAVLAILAMIVWALIIEFLYFRRAIGFAFGKAVLASFATLAIGIVLGALALFFIQQF